MKLPFWCFHPTTSWSLFCNEKKSIKKVLVLCESVPLSLCVFPANSRGDVNGNYFDKCFLEVCKKSTSPLSLDAFSQQLSPDVFLSTAHCSRIGRKWNNLITLKTAHLKVLFCVEMSHFFILHAPSQLKGNIDGMVTSSFWPYNIKFDLRHHKSYILRYFLMKRIGILCSQGSG